MEQAAGGSKLRGRGASPSPHSVGEWVRASVSDLYPEDIVLGRGWNRLLHAFVQLLFHRQVPRDGPSDLGADVVKSPQASLCTADKTLSYSRGGHLLCGSRKKWVLSVDKLTCRERAVLGGTLATSPCSFLFLNLRKYSWMRNVA